MTNPEKQAITEAMNVHQAWVEEAKGMTPARLAEFTERVINGYEHDYGTICHAIAAVAVAGAYAANKMEQGGVTGFQAGAIMWEFIRGWRGLDGPARLQEWKDALYPQHASRYNGINPDTWEWMQEEARRLLKEHTSETAHPDVRAHWQSIADGVVPFGLQIAD